MPNPNPIPPNVIFTAKLKGGVGATTLALVIADLLDLADRPLSLIQADTQARLANMMGRNVETIAVSPAQIRLDPSLAIRAYGPIARQLEQLRPANRTLLADFGPNETGKFLEYARLAEMDEDLKEYGLRAVALVPATAESEALRAAAMTLADFARSLPTVERYFVRNERDGLFENLHPASDAAQIWRTELAKELQSATQLRMPVIPGRSWQVFEAVHSRFTDAVAMSVVDVMEATGLTRPEARIARGDVASWLATMQLELRPVLGPIGGVQ